MPLKKIIPIFLITVAGVLAPATILRAQIKDTCGCPTLMQGPDGSGPYVPYFMDKIESASPDGKRILVRYGNDSYVIDLTTFKTTLLSFPIPGEIQDWCPGACWCPYNPNLLALTSITEFLNYSDSVVYTDVILDLSTGDTQVITPDTARDNGYVAFIIDWGHSSKPGNDSLYIQYATSGGKFLFIGWYVPQTQGLTPESLNDPIPLISSNDEDTLVNETNDTTGSPLYILNGDTLQMPEAVGDNDDESFSPDGKLLALSVIPANRSTYDQVWIYKVADPNPDSIGIINFQCCFCTYNLGGIYAQFLTDSTLAVSMHKDSAESSPLYEISIDGCRIIRQLTFLPEYIEDYPMQPDTALAGTSVSDTVLTLIYNDSSFCGPPASVYLQRDTEKIPVTLVSSRSDSLVLRFRVPVGDSGTYNLVLLGGGECDGATTTVPHAFTVVAAPASVNIAEQAGIFSVWPTVASNFVSVSIDPSVEPTEFEMVDAMGRIAWQADANPIHYHFDIPTTNLPAGFYVCRLMSPTGVNEAKIIVCH